jgi:phage terminase large subunit-like protein
MVYMDDELSARLNVTESRKHLVDPVSGSIYSVLSGEKKGKMGKSSSFLAFDELAEFGTDRTLYDALLTSTGAHDEPMIWVFSTQAPNDVAVLSQLIDYGLSEKGQKDTKFKCFLYSVPNDVQDIYDEKEWYKANPALGDFRSLEEMRDFASKAKFMPTMEMTFRNLYLNQRVGSADQFISPDIWKLNAGEPDLGVFEDKVCYGGLDLSAKNDLTALVIVAKDDAGIIHVLPHFWTPKDGLGERARQDGALYELWASQGFLNAVPGKVIDYKYVAGEIGRLKTKMNLKAIKFDRWRIEDLVKAMDEMGVDAVVASWETDEVTGARKLVVPDHDESAVVLIPYGQGYRDMNPAVERVEDAVVEGRLRHGGHPVLTMCAMNTRIKADPANGRKFDKIKSTGRIDGLVAMAMAIGPDEDFGDVGSVYETRGVLTF